MVKKIIKRIIARLKREIFNHYFSFGKSILSTKPIICDQNSLYEIHILTQAKDLIMSMWGLKTFYHYSGIKTGLFIHDDGSLNSDNAQMLRQHFVNCEIVRKKDADEEIAKYLKDYPLCQKYRLNNVFFVRLFDYLYYSKTKKILMLDSDMLFFRKPLEIIRCIRDNAYFFISDYQNSYSLSMEFIEIVFNMEMIDKFNAGIVYLPNEKWHNLELIESILREDAKVNLKISHVTEQTIWAMLFLQHQEKFMRLPETYQISTQPITEKTIAHHFVQDGSSSRSDFYTKGLKRLKKARFLTKFNKSL